VSSMYRHSQGIGAMGSRTWSVPNCSISEWRFDGERFFNERIGDDSFFRKDDERRATNNDGIASVNQG
jgi:hypothetical protein